MTMTEEHPRRRYHAAGRKLLAAPGQGHCSVPRRPQGRGTEGHPKGSRRGNNLLTRRFLGLRPPGMAEGPVGTFDVLMTLPRG
jgi:hypothetical protein